MNRLRAQMWHIGICYKCGILLFNVIFKLCNHLVNRELESGENSSHRSFARTHAAQKQMLRREYRRRKTAGFPHCSIYYWLELLFKVMSHIIELD